MTCLLLRDFVLRDSVLIWDFLISQGSRHNLVLVNAHFRRGFSELFVFVCAAYLLHFTEQLKCMSMEQTMQFMQRSAAQRNNPAIPELISNVLTLYGASIERQARKDALVFPPVIGLGVPPQ